jgi:hypothetical protein
MRIFRGVRALRARSTNEDSDLCEAVERAGRGLIDADLGGASSKQRIARAGQGRFGGFRVLLALRSTDRAAFIYGFAKNEQDNIDDKELKTLREIAAAWLITSIVHIEKEISAGRLQEVSNDH